MDHHGLVDAELKTYVERMPSAAPALHDDGQFAANVHMMREILTIVDEGLTAEGLDEPARARVIRRAVWAGLDPDEAIARQRQLGAYAAQHARAALPPLHDLMPVGEV